MHIKMHKEWKEVPNTRKIHAEVLTLIKSQTNIIKLKICCC